MSGVSVSVLENRATDGGRLNAEAFTFENLDALGKDEKLAWEALNVVEKNASREDVRQRAKAVLDRLQPAERPVDSVQKPSANPVEEPVKPAVEPPLGPYAPCPQDDPSCQ